MLVLLFAYLKRRRGDIQPGVCFIMRERELISVAASELENALNIIVSDELVKYFSFEFREFAVGAIAGVIAIGIAVFPIFCTGKVAASVKIDDLMCDIF